jgi:putative tryptophan/tyrosine transport system substrate-binding protein
VGIRETALALIPALGIVLAPGPSAAQQEAKLPRVGVIFNGGPGPALDQFRQGLGQLGYIEGRNIAIEPRFAQGQLDRLSDLAADLVRLDVNVIVAVGAVGTRAAHNATTKIPIVFAAVIDPVTVGFAASLERPGGNITGATSFDPQQSKKQFELLRQVMPNFARVALLSDQDIPDALERANDIAARAIGLQPQMLKVKGPTPDLDGAFAAMNKEGAEALVVLEVPVTIMHRKRIAELASAHRLPTMFVGGRTFSDAGGLITYGTSILDTLPLLPGYVDKILKGAKPRDMPIEVVTRHSVIFNLQTAQTIGMTIPPELLRRADQVIQ